METEKEKLLKDMKQREDKSNLGGGGPAAAGKDIREGNITPEKQCKFIFEILKYFSRRLKAKDKTVLNIRKKLSFFDHFQETIFRILIFNKNVKY